MMVDGLLCANHESQYFCKSLMRDLTDQSHAHWIVTYQNVEKEWGIQALCGEGGDL